jgi:hypothetical protein
VFGRWRLVSGGSVAKPPPHRAHLALLREFVSICDSREVAGLATYGEFEPLTDTRCLSQEASEELFDAWNYMKFLELKHGELRGPIQEIRAKLVLLYGDCKKLKELELTLTREGDL